MSLQKRLIVGISGASGAVYGVRLLQALQPTDIETHLVMSQSAEVTLAYETDFKVSEIQALADVNYPVRDIGAAIASGSFSSLGMIESINTVSRCDLERAQAFGFTRPRDTTSYGSSTHDGETK